LKSPRIAESQPLNNVLASQAFPNNRYKNTALRKPCFRTDCEIAWSFRGAARYQGLVPTLSDTMLSLGTSKMMISLFLSLIFNQALESFVNNFSIFFCLQDLLFYRAGKIYSTSNENALGKGAAILNKITKLTKSNESLVP